MSDPVASEDIEWSAALSLEDYGFEGFLTVRELTVNSRRIPDVRGVYTVVRPSDTPPSFIAIGTGGHFKGKNPNVAVEVLRANWVKGTPVVYIGKAGDPGSAATLRSRLRQYLRFGAGANVGHWGGRYVWQLEDSADLLFCWKPLPEGRPSDVELDLIDRFRARHGTRPFANLTR